MSRQRAKVTSSPNHWCASSCASVSSSGALSNTGFVTVSSAYPTRGALSMIAPADPHGYLPYTELKKSIMAGNFCSVSFAPSRCVGSTAIVYGTPPGVVPMCRSNFPTVAVTR